jgi:hypothetical protein
MNLLRALCGGVHGGRRCLNLHEPWQGDGEDDEVHSEDGDEDEGCKWTCKCILYRLTGVPP